MEFAQLVHITGAVVFGVLDVGDIGDFTHNGLANVGSREEVGKMWWTLELKLCFAHELQDHFVAGARKCLQGICA